MRPLEDPDRAREGRRAFLWGMGALTLLPSLHAVYLAGWELGLVLLKLGWS